MNPYDTLLEALREYRSDHMERPETIHVGTEFYEGLTSCEKFLQAWETDMDESGVEVRGIEVRENPEVTGIQIPDDRPGMDALHYP